MRWSARIVGSWPATLASSRPPKYESACSGSVVNVHAPRIQALVIDLPLPVGNRRGQARLKNSFSSSSIVNGAVPAWFSLGSSKQFRRPEAMILKPARSRARDTAAS